MKVEELLKPFPIKEFHPFPRAMLGPGAWELLGPEAKKLGFNRVLVMTSGLRGSDIVPKIVGSLRYHGLEVVLYDKVESNPKDYNVMDAVALYTENKCDSFISIGGGSSHDACKGARISVAHDGRSVNEFEGFNKSENPKPPPHTAVPRRRAPGRRPPGPTSSPTRRPIRSSRTSTSPSMTRPWPRSRSTTRPCTTAARSTTRRSAASTCSRTPASRTSPG